MKTKVPPRNLLIGVWFILTLLMLINFGLSHFDIGVAGTAASMIIAFTQMLLVMYFFMRLGQSTKLIRLFAAAGFFWLLILFVLVFSDYMTRQWH